jgi:hypothetical protein
MRIMQAGQKNPTATAVQAKRRGKKVMRATLKKEMDEMKKESED